MGPPDAEAAAGAGPPLLKARSITRGRVRWDLPPLYRSPRLAAELERLLLQRRGIEAVRANPLTGRLLVFHAVDLPMSAVGSAVLATLGEAVAALRAGSLPRVPAPPPEMGRALVVGGGSLAVGGLVSLAAGTLTPLMVAGSVCALALSVQELARLIGARGSSSPKTYHRVLRLVRPHRRRILGAAGVGVASVFSAMARVFFIGAAVNLLASGNRRRGFGLRLAALSAIGLAANALHSLLEYAGSVQWRKLSEEAQNDLRLEAYTHIQALEISTIERRRHGELLTILGEDVHRVQVLFVAAWDLFQMVVRVVPACVVFLVLAPRVAWVTLSWVPIILRVSAALFYRALPLQRAAAQRQSVLLAQLSESLNGFETIKSFTIERFQLERVRALGREVLGDSARATAVGAAFGPILEVLIMGATVATMVGAALFAGPGVSGGTYSILLMLTGQLYWPLTELGRDANELQRSLVSLDRVYDLIEEEVREPSGSQPLDPARVGGEILVDGVVFGYDPGHPVLHGVRMRFARGRTTAVVGPTGSGKSTLAKLLLRFYEAQEGAIRLDGEDIRDFAVRDLRRSVSLASQSPFLFFGSVRENIALGDPGAPLAAVRQAARWAHASRFIEALPGGYEAQVEEHGQKLSGGERQRISLARALMKDAPVLLLDEATSQVDNRTEAAIVGSLREIRRERTTVIIAHRLSAVRDADYTYVLDQGRVAEEGKHEDLVRLGGTYAALWRLQSGPHSESGA